MAFGTFTLTAHFDAYGGGPAAGAVRVDGIPQIILDPAGNTIKVGPKTVVLDTNGNFTLTLPTDSASGDSTTQGYRVTPRLTGLATFPPVEFYAKQIGATVDLADITTVPIEPVSVSGENAEAAAVSAEAAAASAAAAAAVGTTNDTVIAGRVNDPASATRAALSATYALADPVTAITYNGDGTVATVTEAGVLTSYAYNTDGTIASQTRLGVTRTYAYSGGNLTGIA